MLPQHSRSLARAIALLSPRFRLMPFTRLASCSPSSFLRVPACSHAIGAGCVQVTVPKMYKVVEIVEVPKTIEVIVINYEVPSPRTKAAHAGPSSVYAATRARNPVPIDPSVCGT
eukprot:2341722-Rhodomonas_salina.2